MYHTHLSNSTNSDGDSLGCVNACREYSNGHHIEWQPVEGKGLVLILVLFIHCWYKKQQVDV